MRIEAHWSVVDDVHWIEAEELFEASEDPEISSTMGVPLEDREPTGDASLDPGLFKLWLSHCHSYISCHFLTLPDRGIQNSYDVSAATNIMGRCDQVPFIFDNDGSGLLSSPPYVQSASSICSGKNRTAPSSSTGIASRQLS